MGTQDGDREGSAAGRTEGARDGEKRADQQSLAEVRGPASQDGQERARHSDAASVGSTKGVVQGDEAALQAAQQIDYPKAVRAYQAEQFNRAPKKSQRLNFVGAGNLAPAGGGGGPEHSGIGIGMGAELLAISGNTGSRFRPTPTPGYATTQENNAYRDAYESAYRQAFDRSCESCRWEAANRGERDACSQAANDAHRRDYGMYFMEGKQQGYRVGYDLRYPASKNAAYQQAYQREFRAAADQSFRASYDLYRQRHFTTVSETVYRDTYAQLLESARSAAYSQTKAKKYPAYAQSEAARAKQDQRIDFQVRPLRITKVLPTSNGKLLSRNLAPGANAEEFEAESGSDILLKLSGRNFGANAPVRVQILVEEGAGLVYLPENTFASNEVWSADATMSSEDNSPKLRFRPEAVGQMVRISVSLRGASGESDRRAISFRVTASSPQAPTP